MCECEAKGSHSPWNEVSSSAPYLLDTGYLSAPLNKNIFSRCLSNKEANNKSLKNAERTNERKRERVNDFRQKT